MALSIAESAAEQSATSASSDGNFALAAQQAAIQINQDYQSITCGIWLFSDEKSALLPVCRVSERNGYYGEVSLTRRNYPIFFQYFESNRVLAAEAARLHPATSGFNRQFFIPQGTHSLLAVGIEVNGELQGLITLEFDQPSSWGPDVIISLQQVATDLADELNKTRQLEQQAQNLLFRYAIEQTNQRLLVVDAQTLQIVFANRAHVRFSGRPIERIVGQSVRTLRTFEQAPEQAEVVMNQVLADKHADGEMSLVSQDGRTHWFRYQIDAIDVDGCEYLLIISEDISGARSHQHELELLAWNCALTGLSNRARFLSHIQQRELSLLLLVDVKGFRSFNDLYGEQVGDGVLQEVARRLRNCGDILGTERVYRIGADEFVLAFTAEPNKSCEQIATMIGKRLSAEIIIGGQQYRIDATVAGLNLQILSTQITPLAALDMAMAEAKNGRFFQLYDSQLQQSFLDQAQLEVELTSAVSRRQLVLHYQPLIDVKEAQISGAEALIRWQHPRLGLLFPGRFIDIAERSGLIEPIGRWVLESALYQLYLWQRRWPDLKMHVNVSVKQLLAEEFYEICWNQLNRYRVKPGSFVLEITENTLMEDVESVSQLCDQLGELGLVLAIDDFGTGYSSMSYLKQLPVQKLKIDRSFVADLEHSKESRQIVPAIIAMGKALNMSITAEGVENGYQEQFLRTHLCDEIQGFLYSKAIPAQQFESKLTESYLV
ncbi:EAL domain-containing protein [uncultured Ferrimonas sp.]|uniref:putative bifunctional diguanylate cyclase/phosphodiesterase n=1 Tax=uncultured Ferrimonas sp. TaxID=432640 RepID=UPI0026269049|nr:EAL domain-containing protein [uncultured Ferrimonas sp.]